MEQTEFQVKVVGNAEMKPKFPCLMISDNGSIVLMSMQCRGTLLVDPKQNGCIGRYAESWNMDVFNPFEGELILSNKKIL